MKWLKRLITSALIVSMALSSSLTSLAGNNDNLNDNTNSGGQIIPKPPSGGTANDDGVFRLYGHFENQGYRISIVDKDGERVTNSVDIVEYIPDVPETSNNQAIIDGWYKYQDWFGWHKAPAGKTKANSFYFSNGIKTEEFSTNTWTKGGVPVHINKYGAVETKMYMRSEFEQALLKSYNKEVARRRVSDAGAEDLKEATIDNLKITWAACYGDNYASLDAGGDKLVKLLKSAIGRPGEDNPDGEDNLLTFIVNMSINKANNHGVISSEEEGLFKFVDSSLQSRVGKEEVNKTTGEKKEVTVSTIIAENNYKVIIEPVYWHVMELYNADPAFVHDTNNGDPVFAYSLGVWYGTASYLNKYILEISNLPEKWYSCSYAGIPWGECDLGVTSLMLERNDEDLKIVEPSVGGLTKVNLMGADLFPIGQLASGDNYKTIGYSVHIYDNLLETTFSGTPTWDKDTYPPNNYKPGPSPENTNPDGTPKLPDYPSEQPEYPKEKDHQFHIVKFYAEKNPDGSYRYLENHTRDNTVHDIRINDEPNYTVDNYYTSSTYTKPTNPTDDYDIWKTSKAPKVTYEGTKSGQVTIKPSDPDTTLYIRLVSTPMLTIVKYFPDKEKTVEEIPWQPTYDTTEPGYDYEKDKQNPDKPDSIPNNFEDTTGTPGSNPIITVDPSTRVVYIKYVKPALGGKITLHQNELAHTFTMSDIQGLVTLTHTFPSKAGGGSDEHYCGGCRHDSDGSWCPGHPCSWQRHIVDSNYSYSIENKMDYGSTTFVGSQGAFKPEETGTVDDRGSLGIDGGSTNGLTPNLKFSIYRDKVKDNVTLYPNKNNSVKGELAEIYITKEGYTPQTNRVQNEGQTEWNSTFKIDYQYASYDNTLGWDSSCSYDGSNHGDVGTWDAPEPGVETINNPFSQANNVLTKAFLGQPGTGDKQATMEKVPFNVFGKNFIYNLKFVPSSGDTQKFANDGKFFEFYPYVEMEYQTVTDPSNKLAYIVSTNLSKVRNNTAVEVGVYKGSGKYGINLSSEQWSTHARTIQGLTENGIEGKYINKSLIPGGAVVKLNTSNSSSSGDETQEVWVGFRAYEMSVPDDLKVTLSSTDGVKTTSEAKAAGSTFFNDVKNNLSNYHVEKWIKEGITKDENALNNSTKVSGINNVDGAPATSFGGNTLSKDSKYYLKSNVSDATSSKFDIIQEKFEQHVYRIYSDVYGKVTVTKDGSELISSNIKADKNLSGLLGNEEVKKINDRVKLIENFIISLDFEGGRDREAIPWYYEAHDGLEVVETIGAAQVGFGGSSPIRSETVDPKLTGKLANRDDTLNFNSATINEKTRTVQYRMSASPTTKPGVAGYIGTFNGMDITVPTMNNVMRTRLHYMGNNTVMDLN